MTSIEFKGKAEMRRTRAGEPGVVFYDDARARAFEPFALTRPVCTLVSGARPTWARWGSLGLEMSAGGAIIADHLVDYDEGVVFSADELPAGSVIVNSRFTPAPNSPIGDSEADTWIAAGRTVAVRLDKAMRRADFDGGSLSLDALVNRSAPKRELLGWWHDEVWDYLRYLPEVLAADLAVVDHEIAAVKDFMGRMWKVPAHATVVGNGSLRIFAGFAEADLPPAHVDPHVVFDTTGGPITVESGAVIHSFTRINGPCYIGANATIMGGDITGCSIGPVSKIRGEISGTIVLGYSNKGHDGFVGNSYLGQWVNLGASTVTSNLKNTYGPVSLWTPTGVRPTGMQFLGTLFGDHVKTGIGTRLTTGTVLGAGANVYGSQMPPKAVAPFSWGDGEPYDLYQIDKFLSTAATVMSRRKVALTDRMKRQLTASFEKRWSVK